MSILSEIVENKLQEIQTLKQSFEYSGKVLKTRKPNFLTNPEFQLIAEIKPKSPSAGIIRKTFDPVSLVKEFEKKGASGISVLTDEKYFGGSLELFKSIRENTVLPLLRKDFILEEIQLFESKKIGADLVLLIVKILSKEKLLQLTKLSLSLELQPVIEFNNLIELEIVTQTLRDLNLNSTSELKPILAVNNRNLETFETSIETCLHLETIIPSGFLKFALSGIKDLDDLEKIKNSGYHGVLIGQGLVTNPELFEEFCVK